ncbi:conserved hypothetical protein [Vibrio coralliirubri]|uniref:hypothetical protein n=1 Tax=Vibrio coralliirubri TaxID=1516159 RepID=UPI000630E600|nr:conserved hypothetical protein [Vibrio coralliirubri]
MIAREWKTTCPKEHEEGFIAYLYETGIKDTSCTRGFLGAQIFNRDLGDDVEITLLTYWENLECIKAFSGENISVAKLYPEDEKYKLNPDRHVSHYKVRESMWLYKPEALITSLVSSGPKHEETLMTIAEQLRQQGEQRGRQEGRQEGIQLGEEKGRQEALKEMARKMLLNGLDQQTIMDVTGLNTDELAQLSH